jgi:hypothetical protein
MILIASAAAAAGIIHHAIFGVKAARYRPPARVKGGRAGRIASLASEGPPLPLAVRRQDSRKREPAEPIEEPNLEKGIQQLVLDMVSRAA